MSRMPRLIAPGATWLRGLRACLRQLQRQRDVLTIADDTAGAAFVLRAAERLSVAIELLPTRPYPMEPHAISPVDRELISTAEIVFVLGVRTNGNIHRLVRERLQQAGNVEVVDLPDLQTSTVREEFRSLGAHFWTPDPMDQLPFADRADGICAIPVPADRVYEVVPFPSREDWMFLSHTTRACAGRWPGQSEADYIDSLLDDAPDADHSPSSTLQRIIRQRRLLSSSRCIRGQHRVVCLTQVPLHDLPELRQFRTHRSRWDFEPYGLCIHRDWLERQGARSVIYGDEATWASLSESDRPFFQLSRTGATSPADEVDWTTEREWRHAGDLDLKDLAADQCLVFVPNSSAARQLYNTSPWPITLWPDPALG